MGLTCLSSFAGHVVAWGALDVIGWIRVHPIIIKACDDFVVVDLINEIRRPQFNRIFDELRRNTWHHVDSLMKIRHAIIKESCDRGPLISGNLNLLKPLQRIGRHAFFVMKFPIKTVFSLCKLNF